jgi:hypothetical protein
MAQNFGYAPSITCSGRESDWFVFVQSRVWQKSKHNVPLTQRKRAVAIVQRAASSTKFKVAKMAGRCENSGKNKPPTSTWPPLHSSAVDEGR